MDEREIKAEARLVALEYFIANLYAQRYLQLSDPLGAVNAATDRMLDRLQKITIPYTDPAVADMLSAELREAVHHIATMVAEMVEMEIRRRSDEQGQT